MEEDSADSLFDSEPETEQQPSPEHYGCSHYKRKAKLVAPCCNKVYTCRFCHDDAEAHQIDRKQVTQVECSACGHRQPVQQACTNCDIVFASYFCGVCRLFDDEMKSQYHCEGCGICRVGGRENFFHCPKCDMCLPRDMEEKHKCVEKVSRTNCAVCMEDIHTSRISSHIPPCGHMIHKPCFRALVNKGYYACPTCNSAMFKMEAVWNKLDQEVAETQMPAQYRNCYAKILCNDCQAKTVAKFHVIGLKCGSCGSYNTARSEGPLYRRNAKQELVPFTETDDEEDFEDAQERPAEADTEPEAAVAPPADHRQQ